MNLYAPSTIKAIQNKHGFRLSKSLGQNFLTDKNIIDKIMQSADVTSEDLVLEIGPGFGVLTKELAERAGKVIAVEIDKTLIPILEENLKDYHNILFVNQDILNTDINQLLELNKSQDSQRYDRVKIIGNLPYYITTPILMKILEDKVKAESITIMMQKEVAQRIMADPGSKAYGAISAVVKYYCNPFSVITVPASVFYPPPKVDSAVLRLDIRKRPPVNLRDERVFFQVIKAGFGQRRKTLENSLTGVESLGKEDICNVLRSVNIDGKRRAETLSLDELAQIANEIYIKIETK